MELKRGDVVLVDAYGTGFGHDSVLGFFWRVLDGAVEVLFQPFDAHHFYRWYPVSMVRKVGEVKLK